nr:hypothetical protein RAR13_01320 [Aminobacter aminovorans]
MRATFPPRHFRNDVPKRGSICHPIFGRVGLPVVLFLDGLRFQICIAIEMVE